MTINLFHGLAHECGHALHGLLSNVTYESLSGTAGAHDFVEFGSQIMENWMSEPEVLRLYAKHHETGAVIPDEIVEKLQASGKFNQGFITVEYVAASYLDMAWHSLTQPVEHPARAFEQAEMDRIGLIPEILPRYRSTYYSHIFDGGYSAGYYAYLWAEVLDKDAFQAFKETGNLFDPATAKRLRESILSRGGTRLLAGDIDGFGALLGEHWLINKRMDPGCTNPFIDRLFEMMGPHINGGKLAGAGSGGFAIVITRSAAAVHDLAAVLAETYRGTPVEIWPCAIPERGLLDITLAA